MKPNPWNLPKSYNPFRAAVPFRGQTSQIPTSLSLKRDCSPKRVIYITHDQIINYSSKLKNSLNPFRPAVPFWGQTTWNLSGVSPERDRGFKRVKAAFRYVFLGLGSQLLGSKQNYIFGFYL